MKPNSRPVSWLTMTTSAFTTLCGRPWVIPSNAFGDLFLTPMYRWGKVRRSSMRWIIAGTAGQSRASSSENACRSVFLFNVFSITTACLSTDCSRLTRAEEIVSAESTKALASAVANKRTAKVAFRFNTGLAQKSIFFVSRTDIALTPDGRPAQTSRSQRPPSITAAPLPPYPHHCKQCKRAHPS
jgi:hypothetical protein